MGLACKRMTAVWLSILLIMSSFPLVSSVSAAEAAVPVLTERSSPLARYNDLPEQAFYMEALENLTLVGSIEPNEKGGFDPDSPVTRAEFAVWLARSLGLKPVHASVFTDVSASSAEASYINALHQAGLIRGYGDGTFRGDQRISRAEAAVLLEEQHTTVFPAL